MVLEQLAHWAEPILNQPTVKRTRRNHGLEHATVHLLSKRIKDVPMMGRSSDRGFILYIDAPQDQVEAALREALRRMKGGEHQLAVHPGCGTSRLTSGFLASLVAIGGVSGVNRREAFGRLPLLLVLMMLTAIIAEPLGLGLQRHFTTDGDPGDMEILDVTVQDGRFPLSMQPTRVYNIRTYST